MMMVVTVVGGMVLLRRSMLLRLQLHPVDVLDEHLLLGGSHLLRVDRLLGWVLGDRNVDLLYAALVFV